MLATARPETGLAIVTEGDGSRARTVVVAKYADVLQIRRAEYAELSVAPGCR